MKRFIASLLILFYTQLNHAQIFKNNKVQNDANTGRTSIDNYFLNWGYYLGFNYLDFNFDYNNDLRDIYVERGVGFNVGLIGNLKINNYMELRLEPGLVITNRTLHYSDSWFTIDNGTAWYNNEAPTENDLEREVGSTYIYIPLILKVSTKRLNNFKPFVAGGGAYATNLSSNEKNPDDNTNGQFRTKTNVLFYELSFGIDFYLPNFKFTPAIKGVFAINDELYRDYDPNSPWNSNITTMKTRGIYITFTVQ